MHRCFFDYSWCYFRRDAWRYPIVSSQERVHENQTSDIVRMPCHVVHREWPSPIMDDEDDVAESKGFYESRDYSGVMGKVVQVRIGLVRLAESHKIQCERSVSHADWWHQSAPDVRPCRISVYHQHGPTAVSLVYIVDLQTV